MEKDPAFLMYPKDWLEGTAELFPEEKGVFIDLLCHQHQRGAITDNTKRLARMVGLSHEEFLPIWNSLSTKFQLTSQGLVNKRLTKEMNKRSTNRPLQVAKTSLGGLISSSGLSKKIRAEIKKKIDLNAIVEECGHDESLIKSMVREQFNLIVDYKSTIAIGNGNGNEDGNEDEVGSRKEGVGGKQKPAPEIVEATNYLNLALGKTGSSGFKPTTAVTRKLIGARLRDYSLQDLKNVIDLKVNEWQNDDKMRAFLRPQTLFAESNFESYHQQVQSIKNGEIRPKQSKQHGIDQLLDRFNLDQFNERDTAGSPGSHR